MYLPSKSTMSKLAAKASVAKMRRNMYRA
jgi:hypothetical protein